MDVNAINAELIRNEIKGMRKPITGNKTREILQAIAKIECPIERMTLIAEVSKKTGLPKRGLQKELDTLLLPAPQSSGVITENILIAHPACEVNDLFMSLGFKESVIENGKPTEQNFYLVMGDEGPRIVRENTARIGEFNVIFDLRNRILPTLAERWNKQCLRAFVDNPTTPTNVYLRIKQIVREYVEFQNDAQYGLVAAWIIATYLSRCFHAVPFLNILGKKQSGKSRLLELLNRLCFNAIKTKGVSLASLADSVDGVRGTFLQDQAESLSMEKYRELLGILADSYTAGGGKRRVIDFQNRERRIVEFETFGFKAFASTRDIDVDLKDRCITISMIRAEKEYPYPEAHFALWRELRDELYRLALTKWQDVKAIYQEAGRNVKQRVRELWRPIETILTLEKVGEEEVGSIYNAFLEGVEEAQVGLSPLESELFEAIFRLLGDNSTGILGAEDIQKVMLDVEVGEGKQFRSGKALQTWIGTKIKRLYLSCEKFSPDGKRRTYRFEKDHLKNIFNRYQTGAGGPGGAETSIDAGSRTDTFFPSAPQGAETQPAPHLSGTFRTYQNEVSGEKSNDNNHSRTLTPLTPICTGEKKEYNNEEMLRGYVGRYTAQGLSLPEARRLARIDYEADHGPWEISG
ncbi:MAG: hypothetical protein A4E65_00989 [Syntrophorhabdus sp. PtaU1.Bin153]|nr:MAG: hypothetical protein A4E65_00989 [Syntrophorhabdus sp. PtaU1.Bin153]